MQFNKVSAARQPCNRHKLHCTTYIPQSANSLKLWKKCLNNLGSRVCDLVKNIYLSKLKFYCYWKKTSLILGLIYYFKKYSIWKNMAFYAFTVTSITKIRYYSLKLNFRIVLMFQKNWKLSLLTIYYLNNVRWNLGHYFGLVIFQRL